MFGMALTIMQLTSECLRACVRAKSGHFEQLLWKYSATW